MLTHQQILENLQQLHDWIKENVTQQTYHPAHWRGWQQKQRPYRDCEFHSLLDCGDAGDLAGWIPFAGFELSPEMFLPPFPGKAPNLDSVALIERHFTNDAYFTASLVRSNVFAGSNFWVSGQMTRQNYRLDRLGGALSWLSDFISLAQAKVLT